MSADLISDAIDMCSVENIATLIGELKKEHTSTSIFNGASQWFSLQKIGWTDDKACEVFNELTAITSAENLPKQTMITVYRGVSETDYIESGLSWTLDKRVAEWFATRFDGNSPTVVKMVINSSACFGLVDGLEREVLINPEYLNSFEEVPFNTSSKPSLVNYLAS